MNTPEDPSEAAERAKWHRCFGAQANNRAWALSEAASRSAEESEEMLQAAHTAMYHWKSVGNESQQAHAAQLLAHVYALQHLPHAAQHHHHQCAAFFFDNACAPWEKALAHAVAAHVAACGGDAAVHRQHHAQATALTAALQDAEERAIVSATLQVVPKPD